jgi:large subunit ribosomal protein L35
MPKVKTSSAAKKRFKLKKSGKIKYSKSFRRHILTKKTTKRKRDLRGGAHISKADTRRVTALLSS